MILGIDEVGRGPWAGPLVIGAVVLGNPQSKTWDGLNDSKKLSAKKRELQNDIILKNAKATGLGWVSAEELDEIGLSGALKLATKRAVDNIPRESFTEIIIDGTINFLKDTPFEELVTILPKADSKIKEVSAASIIAKVARDNYMIQLAQKYPEYGFDKHVGYGTKIHKEALEKYGPCAEHRKSFRPVAELLGAKEPSQKGNQTKGSRPTITSKAISLKEARNIISGKKAEEIVSEYLKSKGHKILARNHKTKFYEIDIVSATKDHIYFTEVKYRKNNSHGEPLEFIDQKKRTQITFAAESFMKFLSQELDRDQDNLPSPVLAAASVSGKDFHLDQWFVIE